MSNYVKAKLSFNHDSVGTKGMGEVFEVHNTETLSQLESMGYVEKVDSQEFEQQKQLQQEVGRANALANEAVSMAHHVQNQQANQQQQTVAEARQAVMQQVQKQNQNNAQALTKNAQASKKATDKE